MLEAVNVSKIFRVYPRPRHWLLEKITRRPRHRVVAALSDLSLKVGPGECLGLIGTNGAGKTTLLRILAGISEPTRGEVKRSGRLSAILELDSGFHPEFTGRENIRIGFSIQGLTGAEARAREEEIVVFSGLEQFIDLPVRTYSSGMYLRLGFAVATASAPELLLVDEALAVGDEWFRGKCVERIQRIRESGAAIVIASHDLTMIRGLCDRALLLNRGRLTAEGRPLDVINRYLELIYQEAARSAGRAPAPGERPRLGSGEVEITAVRAAGPEPRSAAVFRTGETMTIEFDYRVHAAVKDPLFGINIFRGDGVLAVCTNSEASFYTNRKYWPDRPAGDPPRGLEPGRQGTARFVLDRLPLLEGSYELSVNVYQGRSGAHIAVDEILGAVRFQVVSGDHPDRGVFLCPGRWEIA